LRITTTTARKIERVDKWDENAKSPFLDQQRMKEAL
jgi:hypothetical protein